MPEHEQSVCCLNMIGYKVSAGYGKRKNGIGSIYCKAIEKLVVWKRDCYFASVSYTHLVFAGIYTTAVPLLYNPCGRFAKEGTSQFKILTVALGVIGLIVGLFLPFRAVSYTHLDVYKRQGHRHSAD